MWPRRQTSLPRALRKSAGTAVCVLAFASRGGVRFGVIDTIARDEEQRSADAARRDCSWARLSGKVVTVSAAGGAGGGVGARFGL
jgi:hypothetical protein